MDRQVRRGGDDTRTSTPFTRQLSAWMALAGYDDVQLARVIGVSKATVGRWRLGKTTPDTSKWPALARALNVEEEEIGRLLFNVELYPPHIEAFARVLKKLPPRLQRAVVQEGLKLIEELEAQDAKVAPRGIQDNVYAMTKTNHANGAA